jgi:hypothetical protein
VSAGAFFPQTPLQVPEKKMGQHREQHVVLPAGIFPHFIVRHAEFRFPFLKTLELFRNKRQGKLSSPKTMGGVKRWVYLSETTVR